MTAPAPGPASSLASAAVDSAAVDMAPATCAAERAAGGSFCRTGRGCHVDRPPCRPSAPAKELAGPSAGAVMGTRPAGSWGKSPFGRMGRLHYRTCVRVQVAVPPLGAARQTYRDYRVRKGPRPTPAAGSGDGTAAADTVAVPGVDQR